MPQPILIIDDERPNLLMLEEYLAGESYTLTCFQNAEEGMAYLEAGHPVEAILLDRMMPGMNGLEFFAKLKQSKQFCHIPVIMQTAAATDDQVAEGLQAGVYYYLTKPYKRKVLLALLRNAISDYGPLRLALAVQERERVILAKLQRCELVFQTPEDVNGIASYLGQLYPEPKSAIFGIKELMLNAVEHGNLGISYTDKSQLVEDGIWEEEIQRRLGLAEFKEKVGRVTWVKQGGDALLTIEDEGPGFEWTRYLTMHPSRAFDTHGRGIAMTKAMGFAEIEYVSPGNVVVCRSAVS